MADDYKSEITKLKEDVKWSKAMQTYTNETLRAGLEIAKARDYAYNHLHPALVSQGHEPEEARIIAEISLANSRAQIKKETPNFLDIWKKSKE